VRNFEIDSAMQRLAERRIEQAMREGKFDNLPGRGQPIDLDEMPVDENVRMVWWALRVMRNGEPKPREAAKETPKMGLAACRNRLCASANATTARFCRRCGTPILSGS
jgi:hypothetical protein